MKSQMWLLDPRPHLPAVVRAVEHAFELSEASNTPVMLMLRIRACHVYGRFDAKDNRRPAFSAADALASPVRDYSRIILPPSTYAQEREKIQVRLPAALKFIAEHELNEVIGTEACDVGIVMQGGLYNNALRALELLDCADAFGTCKIPLYLLNVTYPLIPGEWLEFCAGKRAVLIVEEGQPEYIEQAANQILRQNDLNVRVIGKAALPMFGEYSVDVLRKGIGEFLAQWAPALGAGAVHAAARKTDISPATAAKLAALVPPRPSGLCTGCPERPFFAAMKILQKEVGPLHISADIGCHSFATLPPFNMGNSIMGYGLGSAGASAFGTNGGKRAVSIMGDGGFWHNGLTSGIGNAVFNKHDDLTVIIDNGYSAATGGQDIPSSRAPNPHRAGNNSIVDAVKGVGVGWVRRTSTYDMRGTLELLREALATGFRGPKVIVADGECQLNRQRRVRPLTRKAIAEGKRVVRERFGVDPDTCTGDHSCIRLSGCPSLTVKPNPDPLRSDPVAHVDDGCVGCGVCGDVADAAVLCPSFYRAELIYNPSRWDRLIARIRASVIGALQRRSERGRLRCAL
jgi:indolepyruvate ferredoxin oxidoreductase alpha subunit